MGNSCSYNLKQIPPEVEKGSYQRGMKSDFIAPPQPLPRLKLKGSQKRPSLQKTQPLTLNQPNKMADNDDPVTLNGTSTMGLLNGVQSTGNVQSKAAAFSTHHNQQSHRIAHQSIVQHRQVQTQQTQQERLKSSISEMKTGLSQCQMNETKTSSSSSSSSSSTSTSSNLMTMNKMPMSKLPPLKIGNGFKAVGADAPLETGEVLVQEIHPDMQITPGTPLVDITGGMSKIRFEQNQSASTTRVVDNNVEIVQQTSEGSALHKVEHGGVEAQKSAGFLKEKMKVTIGEVTKEENRTQAAASLKVTTPNSSAELNSSRVEQRQEWKQRQTVTSSHVTAASTSTLKITNPALTHSPLGKDLETLGWDSTTQDVDRVVNKYNTELSSLVDTLRDSVEDSEKSVSKLDDASNMMKAAWRVPGHGHQVGKNLCETFKKIGGVDILIENFWSDKGDLRVASARLLEQSLTPDICNYVVGKGFDCLDKVVKVASELCEADESGIGMGLLRHLFRHSESTCSDVLRLQGLDRVIFECRRRDVETLRNCALALVNLSLYGGAENQEAIIKQRVHLWLFPLAFNDDPSIKYYACLAIAILAANKEIETQIIKSNTLQLVEPFLNSHDPEEFAACHATHIQGQSEQWLEKLIPVLSSQREEASSLAAFHFCMEAGIKKRQGQEGIFKKISAIEPLKLLASSPNALASKFAAQALRLIGETVPHKLSKKVPLWSIDDVREWVIQKGFDKFAESFVASRVDGDILLQLTEEMLKDDIRINNGILRRRFMRDLRNLKKLADYTSCDSSSLNEFLISIHPEFSAYTYPFLINNVDKETLIKNVSEDFLVEAGVGLNIHRLRFLSALNEKSELSSTQEEYVDVFISYRRSNGSQLASLLKVHLTMKGFIVFIDVERLEAGKFDNNLLKSIRKAKNFLLVLTPNALDRCIGDTDCKDWVHREIVTALDSQCNIIPIIDNFTWPETEVLPQDMQPVLTFNGVKWIHDYQDACVEKIERFIRGEMVPREPINFNNCLMNVLNSHGNSISE